MAGSQRCGGLAAAGAGAASGGARRRHRGEEAGSGAAVRAARADGPAGALPGLGGPAAERGGRAYREAPHGGGGEQRTRPARDGRVRRGEREF